MAKVKTCAECGEVENNETPVKTVSKKQKYYFFPSYGLGVYAYSMEEARQKVEELRKIIGK